MTAPSSPSPASTPSAPARRWGIAALLGVGVLINYFDRISLSVAAPQLQAEFGFSPTQMGMLFSAFFWPYALLQVPTGLLLDRLGVTRIGRWGSALWAVATGLTACATGFWSLFASRGLLGVAEAPGFPANAKAVGYWFPRKERALATALFDAAAKFSNVIGVPVVALAVVHLGWRWGFAATALLSLCYYAAFHLRYRDPSQDPKLGNDERELLRLGGAVPEGTASGSPFKLLGYLLGQRKIWGLGLGFAAYGYVFYLFLTWLPAYLVQSMHMSILKSAGFAAIPWVCATLSDVLVGGWLIDHLISRGHDETTVRKSVLVGGMLCGLAVFGAVFTTDPRVAIVWISIALAGLAAAAPVSWSLPALIAPKGGAGTVGGIMNCTNNLMGGVAPIVTGILVGSSQSFTGAFLVAGCMLILGILAFILLLGRIEPIPEP